MLFRSPQVLEQMPGNVGLRQTRQHIDEPEELRLELRVLHTEVEQKLVEPRCVRHPRGVVGARMLEERASELTGVGFEVEGRALLAHRAHGAHSYRGTVYRSCDRAEW